VNALRGLSRPAGLDPGLLALSLVGVAAANLVAPHLPDPGSAGQVAWLALVAFPLATLTARAMAPAGAPGGRLVWAALALTALTAALIAAGLGGTPATLSKLVAATLVGLLLTSLLTSARELVAIALLVAAVDAYSVAAGPTRAIVEHHRSVLNAFTLGFGVPGSAGSGEIGASDFAFFALFLGACQRMGLNVRLTWLAMTASFGATMALSYLFNLALPALPLLSLAFLAVNGRMLKARGWGIPAPPEGES